jgi:hypothetical protein
MFGTAAMDRIDRNAARLAQLISFRKLEQLKIRASAAS